LAHQINLEIEGVKKMDFVIRIIKVIGGTGGEMREMWIWTCREQMQIECENRLVANGYCDRDKEGWRFNLL